MLVFFSCTDMNYKCTCSCLCLYYRVLVHLSRAGADVSIYAPDIPQMHVLNHAKGEVAEGETR